MARNIKLKNSQGTDVIYNDVTKVNLLDTDGNEVVFSEQKPTQSKTITPTKSEQVVTADDGFELTEAKVEAIPSEYIIPEGALYITENGDYDVSAKESVNVNVEVITEPVDPPVLSIKSITENGTYNAEDDGADGYSSVIVNVASSGGGDATDLDYIKYEDLRAWQTTGKTMPTDAEYEEIIEKGYGILDYVFGG